MSTDRFMLPPETSLGPVHLTVADKARALSFYQAILGLRIIEEAGDSLALGPKEDQPLVRLTIAPDVRPRPSRTTGLYHYAVLVPTRLDLARALRRLFQARYPVQGASDHGVSEAIYLSDPDGNGIEIYRDRPRSQWPLENGELAMVTEPFDADGVLAEVAGEGYLWSGLPSGTRIGHIHLQVGDLAAAAGFYRDTIGLELMQYYPPGRIANGAPSAAFLSAGGYHHHVGINTWAGVGAPPAPPDTVGLRYFTLRLPSREALQLAADHLQRSGVTPEEGERGILLQDPSQNAVQLEFAS